MGWLGILLWVITNASDLIALVQTVIKLIGSLPKNQADDIKMQVSQAIKAKDKHRLRKILEDAQTVARPMDVKKD